MTKEQWPGSFYVKKKRKAAFLAILCNKIFSTLNVFLLQLYIFPIPYFAENMIFFSHLTK